MSAIDVHTHFVPERFPPVPAGGATLPWPGMQHECGHAHVMISGQRYRTVPSSCWSAREREAGMLSMRIEHQVLSPMPELLSYWMPAAQAGLLIRFVNEALAELVATNTARFSGLGAVPLQDVDAAIEALHHAVGPLGLRGVEIGTHVNGVSIGDPRFRPFFAAAERLNAAIFVHALRPAGRERLVGPSSLEQVVAFPGDVTLGIASMITGGTLEAHPGLRIAFSHGGGGFTTLLPRLEHGWKVIPEIREAMPRSPGEYARRLYVDSLTYDEELLSRVISCFGPDRVMIGSDYPFAIRERQPVDRLEALALDGEARAKIERENALCFLGGAKTR